VFVCVCVRGAMVMAWLQRVRILSGRSIDKEAGGVGCVLWPVTAHSAALSAATYTRASSVNITARVLLHQPTSVQTCVRVQTDSKRVCVASEARDAWRGVICASRLWFQLKRALSSS
jgi:hypothetical protein